MGSIIANISWLPVIVGTIVCGALGAVWYNPKFPTGKIWAQGAGVSMEPPEEFPALAMGMNTLGLLLAAIFIGAVSTPVAVLAILAYGAMNTSGGLFAGKSLSVGLVHIGYWLLGLVVVTLAHNLLG